MVVVPCIEEIIDRQTFRRTFKTTTTDSELVWHRDKCRRLVKVIAGNGWKFQYDNTVPFEINIGDEFIIPPNIFHRLIKGYTDLILEITEE